LICDVVENALKIIGKNLENNNINLKYKNECTTVIKIYPHEMLQVLLNIITNAKDALKTKSPENPYINISVIEEEANIKTIICDNAGGIPEEILDKISVPYFTTKEETGTGLGLYMSKAIVEKHHGGSIEWMNKDDGACFIITLPKEY